MPWNPFCSTSTKRIVAIQSLVVEIKWTTNLRFQLEISIWVFREWDWYLECWGDLGCHHEADAHAHPRTNACGYRRGAFPASQLRRHWRHFPRYFVVSVSNRNSSDSRKSPVKRMVVVITHRIYQPSSVLAEDCIFDDKKRPAKNWPPYQFHTRCRYKWHCLVLQSRHKLFPEPMHSLLPTISGSVPLMVIGYLAQQITKTIQWLFAASFNTTAEAWARKMCRSFESLL